MSPADKGFWSEKGRLENQAGVPENRNCSWVQHHWKREIDWPAEPAFNEAAENEAMGNL